MMSSSTPPLASMTVADPTLSSSHVTNDPLDAAGAGDDQALAQDLGGVPTATVSGPDGVADVTALDAQEVVELEPDRRAPDHRPVDVGEQPRRLDPVGLQVATPAVVVHELHELGERLTGLAEGEHEVVSAQFLLGRHDVGLVVDLWKAQAQAHPSILVITAWQ